MRIFVYEYITGGGLWRETPGATPEGSLLREGKAMVRAVAADFSSLAEVEVVALRDRRLAGFEIQGCRMLDIAGREEERGVLRELSASCDHTLIIAPEIDDALLTRCREVEAAGGRLLGPSVEFVEVASDKHATAERLRAAGVPTTTGIWLRPGDAIPPDFPLPAVSKPCRGAGSLGVRQIETQRELAAVGRDINQASRLEQFVPGLPASVAVLSGPGGIATLPACRQRLSDDGRFHYLGGELPLVPVLDRRARLLAESAVRALGRPRGYVGVDLVLGAAEDGSRDAVIEVNPRLTASYVGLRRASPKNLARAMLDVAAGRPPALSFVAQKVRF
jgi:predicted ATP-grasp superfamily ATP-dependent carboligase